MGRVTGHIVFADLDHLNFLMNEAYQLIILSSYAIPNYAYILYWLSIALYNDYQVLLQQRKKILFCV